VSADPLKPTTAGESEDLETSEWGLDFGDVDLIRRKLELTPTERLRAAQDFINRVKRIRAQNADRG